ncbi:MAG: hypothetical protein KAS62_03560, partial [Candidatus Delongbacteria bacterium]|nr:hypothetical protein [Candidatus Delongbacteria bacterium]
IITYIFLIFCIGLFAQPKAFDPNFYEDSLQTLSKKEIKHYKKYKKKFIKLGLETEVKNGNLSMYSNYMLNLFYHYRVDINEIKEYEKNDISLIAVSRGFKRGYIINNMIFCNAIVIATIVSGKSLKPELSPFSGEVIYSIDEVLKCKYYYEEFPKTIKCYYYGIFYQGDSLFTVHDEYSKPGDKCILFLNYRGKSRIIEDYEDYDKINTFFEPYGVKFEREKLGLYHSTDAIEYMLDFVSTLELLNINESTHSSRRKLDE